MRSMPFVEWDPVYRRICRDFGFDRAADERARDAVARWMRGTDRPALSLLSGASVAIVAPGPHLLRDLPPVYEADAVVGVSAAVDHLERVGIEVDVMVTDLDSNPETAVRLSHEGVPVVVHAHGDNVDLIERVLPRVDREWVIATTQAAPVSTVANFGGFTDGDRAAYLADAHGARALRFPGWLFDDPSVTPTKRRKLVWAERLLRWLECRRSERFPLLDGRRRSIDISGLPMTGGDGV